MSALGIYFGSKVISIVETKGKTILNNLSIPHSAIAAEGLEEKVPEEVKVVALFKDEFRKAQIQAQEATISLSDKDLIMRTFEMPLLPREELQNAVNFEVKKYIPFKIEDIISDFQVIQDRSSRRNIILFMGIKKDTLDKQLSILGQLGLEAVNIDYSSFSILRFLGLTGMGHRGIVGVASVDFQEEEVNFTVLENSFPLFSRDITLAGSPEGISTAQAVPAELIEKLKTELRVSVDYYNRKFPGKNLKEILFICTPEHRSDLEGFLQEMGLSAKFVDVPKYIGNAYAFSLGLIKGYGASLSRAVKSNIRINLVTAKTRVVKPSKEISPFAEAPSLFSGLKVDSRAIVTGILICAIVFGYGIYKMLPVHKGLGQIIAERPQAEGINPAANYEELENMAADFQAKVNELDNLIKKQLYLTEPLDALPRIVPEGIWLDSFSFKKSGVGNEELVLEGMSYLGDSSKEIKLVNSFVTSLKQNKTFTKYFREINVASLDRRPLKEISATHFLISCKR